VAAIVSQHPDQPVVEPADFHDGNELFFALSTSSRELIKELQDLLGLRGDLACEYDITVVVTEGDGQLPGMLIDSKKEHAAVLL